MTGLPVSPASRCHASTPDEELACLNHTGCTRLALRRDEAAEALGVSVRTLDQLIADGRIARVRIANRVLIPVIALHEFLAAHAKRRGGEEGQRP